MLYSCQIYMDPQKVRKQVFLKQERSQHRVRMREKAGRGQKIMMSYVDVSLAQRNSNEMYCKHALIKKKRTEICPNTSVHLISMKSHILFNFWLEIIVRSYIWICSITYQSFTFRKVQIIIPKNLQIVFSCIYKHFMPLLTMTLTVDQVIAITHQTIKVMEGRNSIS